MSVAPVGLHRLVADWYRANGRDLPWRRNPSPYEVLVVEVMLQQTQVERVVPKYLAFLAEFPSLARLAASSRGSVIRAWAGLGYNARAVRLHELALTVVGNHGGQLPSDVRALRALPGLGPYTAAAVACFAFGASVPLADTNIYRVLSRVVHGASPASRRDIDALAASLLPEPHAPLSAAEWHQGLMDIGATICGVAVARCGECPLRSSCAAAPLLSGAPRAVAEASVPYAAKQAPYLGSNRQLRGQVVDYLRGLHVGESASIGGIAGVLGIAEQDVVQRVVDGLTRDGLVAEREPMRYALP